MHEHRELAVLLRARLGGRGRRDRFGRGRGAGLHAELLERRLDAKEVEPTGRVLGGQPAADPGGRGRPQRANEVGVDHDRRVVRQQRGREAPDRDEGARDVDRAAGAGGPGADDRARDGWAAALRVPLPARTPLNPPPKCRRCSPSTRRSTSRSRVSAGSRASESMFPIRPRLCRRCLAAALMPQPAGLPTVHEGARWKRSPGGRQRQITRLRATGPWTHEPVSFDA